MEKPRPPYILGIESSCDETAASVVKGQKVLSNVISSQIDIHRRYGGVVPELASRNHLLAIAPVIREALDTAGVTLDEISAIAATQGPGLGGALLVGFEVAKAMAYARDIPLIPIHHIEAHVHAPFLDLEGSPAEEKPSFPYIALAVSGGHTSIMRVDAPGKVKVLGATLDDAAGECFDKVAKLMGLPYPGGIEIDRLAQNGDRDRFDLPSPLLHRGLDFSFSGLKTAARLIYEELEREGRAEEEKANFAASLQRSIVHVLVKKTLKAARQEKINMVVAAGGVASNSELRRVLKERASRQKMKVFIAPPPLCTDNGAMIAGLGAALYEEGAFLRGDALMNADIFVTHRRKA